MTRLLRSCFVGSVLMIAINTAFSAIEAVQFTDSQQEQRYRALIAELRCLVCQNQNLADSDADLAKDLRRKTLEMLNADKTDEQIRDYMVQRYGDFVLYRPRFTPTTYVLWLAPLGLLIVIVLVVGRHLKCRSKDQPAVNSDELQSVRKLLE